jgi:hypothetical protein
VIKECFSTVRGLCHKIVISAKVLIGTFEVVAWTSLACLLHEPKGKSLLDFDFQYTTEYDL